MARMIPPYIDLNCSSPGESDIFNKLKNNVGIQSWIVLNSLDIASHIKQTSGESDFVVIIPSKGVFCIEVKACSSLRGEMGQWCYGMNSKADPRGPFRLYYDSNNNQTTLLIKTLDSFYKKG